MEKHAIYNTNLGYVRLNYEDNVITYLKKLDYIPQDMGNKNSFTDSVFSQVLEYLDGSRKLFDFSYRLEGTEFQKKVWSALCDIPYGETRTYKEIAISIGNPKASRAVGMANNKNPIILVVPCHRVIGENGKLVGYAGGLNMKEFLLNMEANNR